ncbi:MAG TPA: cytochrome c [Steroidobacteraceae bacterium]|jgi:mono/diheme cytochrome c family protein|nr:cytochrome c [Steroidobacteraceae bacterium]
MSPLFRLRAQVLGVGVVVTILGFTGLAASQSPAILPAQSTWALTATGLLSQPIADSTPDAAQLRRGQYLVAAGDCMSCHLRDGGQPLAGGLRLNTPFGVIYSANITSDTQTGIGAWTNDQFYHAMHDGIGMHGENLYPAFPYPWFRRVSRDDVDAIFAFLKSTPAVNYTPPANDLPFPLSIRSMVKGWNMFFFNSRDFQADPRQSGEWNRGAYLVNGLGHCGGCHTPKNALGADRSSQELYGARLDNWVAPDLTGNDRTGLGGWSIDDVAEYLRNGRNTHAGAGGAMADVVTYSTSLMSDEDRRAMAVYLKSQTVSPSVSHQQPDSGAMRRGAAIYSDACASCHLEDGVGQPRLFPPLGHNAMLQQADATGLEHLVLAGGRIGTSASRPSPLTMPSFAWKLSDSEIADVTTYLRNSWGNLASAVSVAEVHDVRHRLGLQATQLTVNSGDQN